MSVVARMRVHQVTLYGYATGVKLQAVTVADDPHSEEIKRFFDATPSGSFEAVIKNELAAEQFKPDDHFYVSFVRVDGDHLFEDSLDEDDDSHSQWRLLQQLERKGLLERGLTATDVRKMLDE